MSLSKQIFEQMQEEFLNTCDNYENGDISVIDCAVMFKQDNDMLEQLISERKSFLDENKHEIETESESYGKEGYKGFIFSVQQRKTLDFCDVEEISDLKQKIKDLEEKGKLALKLLEKGIEPVDVNTGELLPVPYVKTSYFIKIDKVKNEKSKGRN